MATYTQLKSGNWRAQVRRGGIVRGKTFPLKRDAEDWARRIEVQATRIIASGFQAIPQGYSFSDLISDYIAETKEGGKTKTNTLAMLKRRMGHIPLNSLNVVHLRDFVDSRLNRDKAGGVTIAADLSHIGTVLKWGKHSRHLDLPTHLALEARQNLNARKVNTRSNEREREPTDAELTNLYSHWDNNLRQTIPMSTLCKFALATAMRQEEICSIALDDVDADKHTVIIRNRKDPQRKEGNHQNVPLLPDAWKIIEPILEQRKTGRVFPYRAASVSTAFTRACKTLKIVDLRFHDLRHKAASDLFRMDLEVQHVSVFTGHKSWKVLARYTHTKPEDIFNFIDKKKRLRQ